MAKDNLIGKVTHWYDKIGVAVIELKKELKVGEKVKVQHGEKEFEESIGSMELNHQPIETGKKGQEIAVKFSQKAGEGSLLYPVE
jgi:hypothetical protein